MNVTSRSRYGLKIMMDLAQFSEGRLVKRLDIASRQGVPSSYLDQILIKLRKAGLVSSVRGRDGGYELSKKAVNISVWDIMSAVEGSVYPVICCADEGMSCGLEDTCITSGPWQRIFVDIRNQLKSISLAGLCEDFCGGLNIQKVGGVRECYHRRTNS